MAIHKHSDEGARVRRDISLVNVLPRLCALVAIALAGPSFAQESNVPGVLDLLLRAPRQPDLSITVIGYRYGWRYEYPDAVGTGRCRVEGPLVLPQGKSVDLIFTADDVIHEWTVPELALAKDAIPGLLNVLAVDTSKTGTFPGGATRTSGEGYGKMTFELQVLAPDAYSAWSKDALRPCKAP